MTVWDAGTWLAVLVLGPGAAVVFVAFLRDLRRLLGEPPVEAPRDSAASDEHR